MDLAVFGKDQLEVALGALATVAAANGSISRVERDLFAVLARIHGAGAFDENAVVPVAPAAAASAIVDPHARKRLVQLAVVTAMADGDVTKEQDAAVQALARAVGVDDSAVKVLHELASGHALLARVDLIRRAFPVVTSNVSGVSERAKLALTAARSLLGGAGDPELAWKYKRLGLLPEGTFGRAAWVHLTERKFSLPGEPGGMPEAMAYHDFAHVLSGYGTDPEGEIQQGAFQAGNRREDGFVFLLFVILQFHLGLQATPVAKGERGLFDPKKVMRAVERGAACKVDVTSHWNYLEVADVPLDALRARYELPPL